MRAKIHTSFLAFLLLAFAASAQTAAKPKPASKASAPPAKSLTQVEQRIPKLPPFKPQQPIRFVLNNGMVIFLQEDHELPFIEGVAQIRGGEREVPASKTGLITILGETWRTGGTKDKTGDQLDDFLEARAASVETGGSIDSTSVSFSSLTGDFDDVYKIFVELLQKPEFREDKIELAKQQLDTAISRRNEEASSIAAREARKIGYGADSPYARQAEYWTVASVTRQDLLDFHHKYVYPNNIILGVVGDFDAKAMEARLRATFESWAKGPAVPTVKVTFSEPTPVVNFVEKEDVNQSNIELVTLGTTKDNPDYYAITVMNEALGGGFSARLFTEIRTKLGLAYSVGGGLGTDFDHPGLFRFAMGTKSETTSKSIDALYKEIDRLKTEPFTPQEIKNAKDAILSSFIFNFDSKDKVLREKMNYEFYGYPLDRLEKFPPKIEAVTLEDVKRVVQKYVDRNKFSILVVGKSADFDKPLSGYGTVKNIDIAIPTEPPTQTGSKNNATPAPDSSNAEGKTLIGKIVTAMGGKEKLAAIKTIWDKTSTTRNTPQGELAMETQDTIVYPNKVHSLMQSPMGEITVVLTPESAFMSAPGRGATEMPSPLKDDALKNMKRDLIAVVQHADDPKYVFQAEAQGTVLQIDADGATTKWTVDPNTGRVLSATFKTNTQQGPAEREVGYSDYRTVDGITIPFKRVSKENGQLSQQVEVKEVKFNLPVDEKLFQRPEGAK